MTNPLTKDYNMLKFPATSGIEVYISETGLICFKDTGEIEYSEPATVCLTMGQFRSVLKSADELLKKAEEQRIAYMNGGGK